MAHVSIIGSGNMGQAIQGVVSKGGHTAELVGRDGEISGDVVVLAVPYPAVEDVLAQRGDALAGKVVVDITNPLNFETFDSLVVPADGSATAVIAERLPQSTGGQGVQHQLRRHPRLGQRRPAHHDRADRR